MLSITNSPLSIEKNKRIFIISLFIISILTSSIALLLGGVDIEFKRLINILFYKDASDFEHAIIWEIRLPRLLLSSFVGAGLAISGAAMQAIFRNPLADPGLIGISSGAALGAICTIVLGNTFLYNFTNAYGIWAVPIGAFLGCVLVCTIIYRLSAKNNQFTIISLLLAGIAINAIVGSIIGLLTFISSDDQLRDLTFWSMGSLAGNSISMMLPTIILILISCVGLIKLSRPLNLFLLGEQAAKHLGLDVLLMKKKVFILTAICTGSAVALTGIIGFVGLVVPHVMRLLLGPDHKFLLPTSMLGGAILLSCADILSRTLILPSELPIGLITSALGGPFFLIMLIKTFKTKEI